jgi:TonB family protein
MNFLIDFGVKGALALGVAFLTAWALRRGSASIRYALWTCALASVLALPLALWTGPAWNINRGAVQLVPQAQPAISVVVHAHRPAPAPTWPKQLPIIVWIAGAMAMLVRTAAGHWRVRSLFGGAEEIRDARWLELAAEIGATIGFRRAVRLKRSAATDVPLSYGLISATVLLPSESHHWGDDRRRVVLSHEMIHARRLDSLWGLLAQVALAVSWFNPLAWLAAKEFRKEQERSCDDAVVMAGTPSTVYAAHLVDLARSIAIPEPALGMAERFDLEGRVHALLDAGRTRKAASRKLCAAMFLAALALMIPLAAVHAQSPASSTPISVAQTSGTASPGVIANDLGDSNEEVTRDAEPPAPIAEQSTSSSPLAAFAGSVYDPSGAIIPGAMVKLKNVNGSGEEVTVTDSAGRFNFKITPDAHYLVKVTAPGFAPEEMEVSIDAGRTGTVELPLRIGEVSERVEIVGTRPQSAATPAVTPQRIRVGGMVRTVNLISKTNPTYPADARAEGIEGTVLLKAIVSKDGSLLSTRSISNGVDPRLVSAAMAAVPLWRYEPAMLNGEPVEVITTIAVTFRLN